MAEEEESCLLPLSVGIDFFIDLLPMSLRGNPEVSFLMLKFSLFIDCLVHKGIYSKSVGRSKGYITALSYSDSYTGLVGKNRYTDSIKGINPYSFFFNKKKTRRNRKIL